MNPQIHSRWGLLCPSCKKQLINPNKPWPIACQTCGQRTHLACLGQCHKWLVDLDIDIDPNLHSTSCINCRNHAQNNLALIENLPQASGAVPQDVYKAYKAKLPPAPTKNTVSLWGPYRVDPNNFVPAVTKVLDIVHSTGPKLRWSVKLAPWQQVPMTSLSSKEILLPNYFASPNALGRTHQEVLDAMTGAAIHEAGHAAYDHADTIIQAQRRLKTQAGESTWASATCLNIVCDYNLERKVIERYPAFRHYFTETHRWTVNDTLPDVVKSLNADGAEDKLNVRLAVLVWELLGPGDLENAGGTISPKLKFITQKCFDILKYAYTKGLLNTEPGKLKTARALYELIKVITPVGYVPPVIVLPPSQTPQQTPQPPQPPDKDPDVIFVQPGSQGTPPPPGVDMPETPPQENQDTDSDHDSEDPDSGSDTGNASDDVPDDGMHPGSDTDDPGSPGEDQASESPGQEAQGAGDDTPDSDDQGAGDADGDGRGTDPDSDGDEASGDTGVSGIGSLDQDSDPEKASEQGQGSDHDDDRDSDISGEDIPGIADNTGPEDDDAGEPGHLDGPSGKGGKYGSEENVDPFDGAGDLKDDPDRRKNAKRDALDDLEDQNQGTPKIDERPEYGPLVHDETFDKTHRDRAEEASKPVVITNNDIPKDQAESFFRDHHESRLRNLAPVIGRLKKVLRFRNVDWGGKQTGRRAGTLTRRHVNRLSTLGSDKVFHSTQPDQTPKVRIGLLIDESQSMQDCPGSIPFYEGAKNAATALTGALHGIRGVKLWSWGFADMRTQFQPGRSKHNATMRQYIDPSNHVSPASIETLPLFGGTPTGECMDYAAEVITKTATPDEKVVIFIITDGEAGGLMSTATAVRKWWGKVTFVHIGLGNTIDRAIPFYVGPVTDIAILPDLLSESVSEILK